MTIDHPTNYYEIINGWIEGKYTYPQPVGTDSSGSHFLFEEYRFDKRGRYILDKKKQPLTDRRAVVATNFPSFTQLSGSFNIGSVTVTNSFVSNIFGTVLTAVLGTSTFSRTTDIIIKSAVI